MPTKGSWGGSTWAWRKLRAACLARDGYKCVWCGAPASHADHLIPKSMGGPDALPNLVAACPPCNYARARRTQRASTNNRVSRRRTTWL